MTQIVEMLEASSCVFFVAWSVRLLKGEINCKINVPIY